MNILSCNLKPQNYLCVILGINSVNLASMFDKLELSVEQLFDFCPLNNVYPSELYMFVITVPDRPLSLCRSLRELGLHRSVKRCMSMAPMEFELDLASESASSSLSSKPLQEVSRIRNAFPETWLWTNVSAGYSI